MAGGFRSTIELFAGEAGPLCRPKCWNLTLSILTCHYEGPTCGDSMSAATQLPHLMTVAAFLDWDTPDRSDRWELIDGIPRAMAPPSERHALIHGEAARLIGNHLEEHRPTRSVAIGAGLSPGEFNVRIPDLTVSCAAAGGVRREPVAIVEILSPSNAADTWANVALYATVPSVAEILVLHTEVRAELLRRGRGASGQPIRSKFRLVARCGWKASALPRRSLRSTARLDHQSCPHLRQRRDRFFPKPACRAAGAAEMSLFGPDTARLANCFLVSPLRAR